jgi:hypothetical protein
VLLYQVFKNGRLSGGGEPFEFQRCCCRNRRRCTIAWSSRSGSGFR